MNKLSKNQIFIILVAAVLFAVASILSLINIFFDASNRKLIQSIDENKETNENLRAEYLSAISLIKLDSHATAMHMEHATHQASTSISEDRANIAVAKLKALKVKVKPIQKELISGY